MHKINLPAASARKLTQSILQVSEMLGLYQAELARILRITCSDIGELANKKKLLIPDTESWEQAILFIRLYDALYDRFAGDEIAIYHWLRAENKNLNGKPLYLMVDHGRLQSVLACVEQTMHYAK
jgi:hypothetical protein